MQNELISSVGETDSVSSEEGLTSSAWGVRRSFRREPRAESGEFGRRPKVGREAGRGGLCVWRMAGDWCGWRGTRAEEVREALPAVEGLAFHTQSAMENMKMCFLSRHTVIN